MAEGHVQVAIEATEPDSGSQSSECDIDDVKLSLQGMTMLLNNEWDEAKELFNKYKNFSPLMFAGSSFVHFMQALMTFEDEKLAEAMKLLQETEKKCDSSSNFFKSAEAKRLKRDKTQSEKALRIEDKIQRQIIIGDSVMYQAILTFINQDISSMVKGGWLMRKAWKIYEKQHKDICNLLKKIKVNGSKENSVDSTDVDAKELNSEVLERLLGAVSFGYGCFQLGLSLIPPKILKIIEFLGFEGDRTEALKSLQCTSESRDMKAPMGSMALIWYHTMIRPFFCLDGINIAAGVDEATVVLEKCEKEYPKSALFLFFKGRILRLKGSDTLWVNFMGESESDILRYLAHSGKEKIILDNSKCQVEDSLSVYKLALERCENQRETKLICHYEIGWLNMMKLNWSESVNCFQPLKTDSRWSKCYYGYLAAINLGAMGDVKGAHLGLKEVPGLVKRKNNQIEAFCLRRAEKFKKEVPSQDQMILLTLEVLYLWNALPTCTKEDLERMLEECNKLEDKRYFHVRSLIEGSIYRELDNEEMAKTCFDEAIARHQGMKADDHVPAFACYELGTILCQNPKDYGKGKKFYLQAKEKYKDYDFENRLQVRINNALKRLKSEGTPL